MITFDNQFSTLRTSVLFYCCLMIVCISSVYSQEHQIRIGTFNIEWLGDGIGDHLWRTPKDYKAIASVIETIDCDVLALQEIENEAALKMLLENGKKKYNYFIDSTTSNQHKVAIVYDVSFQKIDAQYIHFRENLLLYKRPALYLKLKKKNQEFEFVTVHLKSSFKKKEKSKDISPEQYTPQEIRSIQTDELITWMKKNQKHHSIVLGDFNEEYEKGTILKRFEKTFNSQVISHNLISCANSKWKMIDHIILPEHFRKKFSIERLQNYNHKVLYQANNAPKISDHCLLYYTLTY